jgi:hypothetical protein
MRRRTGGCNCGRVKFEVSGTPVRVGLCHCLVCRKGTGSLGNLFAVWNSDEVAMQNTRDLAELATKTTAEAAGIVRERIQDNLRVLQESGLGAWRQNPGEGGIGNRPRF